MVVVDVLFSLDRKGTMYLKKGVLNSLGLLSTKSDFLMASKTYTENWDSERHQLELSWPI